MSMNAYEAEVREILGNLQQSDRDTIANWLSKQRRLETEGPNGYSNVSVVVAWLLNRRFAITEANLTTALTNSMNNGHRKLFFKEVPRQDRVTPNGRPNHALTDNGEGFMPKSETNRTWRDIINSNRSKAEAPVEAIHENFQAKADTVQGRTHSQTDQARRIVCTVPGTKKVDWQATYEARLRFVSRQQPAFVRR
jgi:hypothetical protein